MLPPYYFYWFRIDIKLMSDPWLDQALMASAYRSEIVNDIRNIQLILKDIKNIELYITFEISYWL